MKVIALSLDEEVDAALEALCTAQGRDKIELVREVVYRYVEAERLRRTLQDPALADLYASWRRKTWYMRRRAWRSTGVSWRPQTTHDAR